MALRATRSPRLRSLGRGSRGALALATLLCTLAALVATAPALRHAHTDFLAGGEPGHGEAAPGDHLQSAYRLWLPGHQIEEGRYPWRDPYSFRPVADPQLNPAAWPFGLPFWPLWRVMGIVGGWNLFVLLGLVAAGLFAYAWLKELGLRTGPAIVGALVFEIAPYRLEQTAAGHLLAPISALLPLALWTFERARRGSRWWLLPSALAIASIPASGQVHLALGAVPFYLAYVLVRSRQVWPLVGAAAGVMLAAGAAVAVWLFTIDGSIGEGGRSLRQVDRFSAELLDFVSRTDRHGSESFVFLGWLTPLVAIAGLFTLVRRRSYGLAAVFGGATLVSIVLALGTNTPIYEAVRFAVWPLRYPRVPERLMPVACLALAALVAFAVDWLAKADLPRRVPRQATVVACLAVVLLLADLRVTTFEATAADQGNDAYAALPEGRVLEVPVFRPGIHYGGVYLYYTTQTPRPRPQGYSTLAPEETDGVARSLAAINCGDWSRRPERLLRRLGVTSVVFHGGLYRDNPAAPDTAAFAWQALARHGYRPQAADGPVVLLARRGGGEPPPSPVAEPPRDAAQFCDGWLPNDGEGRVTSAQHASLWAYNEGGADLRLFLRAEGRRPRDIRLTVDGRRGLAAHVAGLGETRLPLSEEGWHLVTLDGPRGVRVVAYALS
ncbi:MAG TPA: hypothetical protein VFR32_04960 [Gaiellaceae bacterium]|nr:hypothetical protein [Gaiellaceae bacterium]